MSMVYIVLMLMISITRKYLLIPYNMCKTQSSWVKILELCNYNLNVKFQYTGNAIGSLLQFVSAVLSWPTVWQGSLCSCKCVLTLNNFGFLCFIIRIVFTFFSRLSDYITFFI